MSTLLTTRQAAELLGYTNTKAFTNAVKRDRIPCVRINARVIRYDQAELERWLKGGIYR